MIDHCISITFPNKLSNLITPSHQLGIDKNNLRIHLMFECVNNIKRLVSNIVYFLPKQNTNDNC